MAGQIFDFNSELNILMVSSYNFYFSHCLASIKSFLKVKHVKAKIKE